MSVAFSELPIVSSNTSRQASTKNSPTEQQFLTFRTLLAEQYQAWTNIPAEERIRHKYLKDHGLSETGLDNLSPQERSVHEEKITELTKQPAFANFQSRGAVAGDALSRPVISLQFLLDISDPLDRG